MRASLMRLLMAGGIALVTSAVIYWALTATPARAEPVRAERVIEGSARIPDNVSRLIKPQFLSETAITVDVPILMYHHIGAPFRSRYNISRQEFEAQMDYLAQRGYSGVSIDQIAAALRGQGSLPPCPVAITFDDGYSDVYSNALPILLKDGLRATFYVIAGTISTTRQYLTWPQVKDLAAHGMWIGSHSYTHPFLARLASSRLKHQIVDARVTLEEKLGTPVTTFAYPYGSFSLSAMRLVSDTGYTAAVRTGHGPCQSSDRIYQMNRIGVYNRLNLSSFIAQLPRHGPDGSGICPLAVGSRQ